MEMNISPSARAWKRKFKLSGVEKYLEVVLK